MKFVLLYKEKGNLKNQSKPLVWAFNRTALSVNQYQLNFINYYVSSTFWRTNKIGIIFDETNPITSLNMVCCFITFFLTQYTTKIACF
jgi:hypothetical protein